MKKITPFHINLVIAALVAGFLGGLIANQLDNTSVTQDGMRITEERVYVEESSAIDAIEKVAPAVASIVATKDLEIIQQQPFPFFNPQPPQQSPQTERRQISGGSGFLLTEDGLFFTNKHVVLDDDADYTVILNDGSEYTAEIIDRDPLNDLAVMQLKDKTTGKKPKGLPTVTLGDSDQTRVGQRVLAIGNALSEYENTVTMGIISGKGREVTAGGGRGFVETLTGVIQTDAAINPGNSGGPLVNIQGEVIGVNTAVANANGIGFAIPINDAKQVIESIKAEGRIVRPQLGVRHVIISKDNVAHFAIPGFDLEYGALLVQGVNASEPAVVLDSPADKAGLEEGDVILEVDGKKITVENTLQKTIQSYKPGDKIRIKVWDARETREVTVTLGEA